MINNKYFRYVLYIIFIYIAFVVYSEIFVWNFIHVSREYAYADLNFDYFAALAADILLGTLFGLEHIKTNRKIIGKWRTNWLKLAIVGSPLLLMSMSHIVFIIAMKLGLNRLIYMLAVPWRQIFFRLFLGYIIITSFYKKPLEEKLIEE